MHHARWYGICLAALFIAPSFLLGCPLPGDVGVTLLVKPSSLNFGEEEQRLRLRVNKNYGSDSIGPITVESDAEWLIPEDCQDEGAGCTSNGVLDWVFIDVRIDRSMMRLGTNRATLRLQAAGASLQTVEVTAEDLIEAAFTASDRKPEVGRTINFLNDSVVQDAAGAITGYSWDFGDGATSTEEEPVHAYAAPGYYTVSLQVRTDDRSETTTKRAYIAAGSTEPVADFEVSATNIAEKDRVTFTDLSTSPASPILERRWEFGDGVTSTDTNPSHQYLEPGVYSVSLTIWTEFSSATELREQYIVVSKRVAPTANFALSYPLPFLNIPVTFTDLSVPGSAEIQSWVWRFGDGGSSGEQNPVYTYKTPGLYNISLTVVSAEGNDTKELSQVVVDYAPPTPVFTADPISPSVYSEVQFTDDSVPSESLGDTAPIDSWLWDFGDGQSSTEQNPVHQYSKPGTYTVSLTVGSSLQPSNNTATLLKEDYLEVLNPPSPDFRVDTLVPLTTEDVLFINTTLAGSETEVTYLWDFGDDESPLNQSTAENPTHLFSGPGTFIVTLTAITPTREESIQKSVIVARPPIPDFSADPIFGNTIDAVVFSNLTDEENAQETIGYLWDFGDGQIATSENPEHLYTLAGTYSVSLTVSFLHSDPAITDVIKVTEKKQNYITIAAPLGPVASFEADDPCAITGANINFTDLSLDGDRPVTDWLWDFGDGNTSSEQHPLHAYNAPGSYTVSLTVTAEELINYPDTIVLEDYVFVIDPEPIDYFVRGIDPNDPGAGVAPGDVYDYSVNDSYPVTSSGLSLAQAHVIRMTSQQWRSSAEIYEAEDYTTSTTIWSHNVNVFVPTSVTNNTALLYIGGGSHSSAPITEGSSEAEQYSILARATGSIVVTVDNVPGEPLIFTDELDEDGKIMRSRSEDDIIAYSYDRFMETSRNGDPDYNWPLLFPMARVVVRAMDTAQDFLDIQALTPVDDFVLLGASKRGWTSWMATIADCRVRATAPVVIDVLNMDEQMEHHRNAYGYWAPAIYPYAQMRVFDRLLPDDSGQLLPEAQELLSLVDPYEYRDRLTKPKFIFNSTGDQFFVPDSSQFYLDSIPGQNYLDYVPNSSHAITDSINFTNPDNPVNDFLAWYLNIVQDIDLPEYSWSFETDGSIVVTVDEDYMPKQVVLWQAVNTEARDFRLDTIGEAYTSTILTADSDDPTRYVAQVATPAQGWVASLIQLSFANKARLMINVPGVSVPDLIFTTPVRVWPEEYPDFQGERMTVEDTPQLTLHGTAQEMGAQYGRLMATEIGEALTALATQVGALKDQLTAIWDVQASLMDARILDEVDAIAAAAIENGAPSLIAGEPLLTWLKRAHMLAAMESFDNSATAMVAWKAALFNDADGMEVASTVNWPLAYGLHNYRCIVTYVPDEGIPHTSFTFAGLALPLNGVNLGGISLTEAPVLGDRSNETDSRIYFAGLFREVLYDAMSMTEALDRITAVRTLHAHDFILGDGRYEGRAAAVRMWPDASPEVQYYNGDAAFPNVLAGGAEGVHARQEMIYAYFNISVSFMQGLLRSYGLNKSAWLDSAMTWLDAQQAQSKASINGLIGEYYNNITLQGLPVQEQIETQSIDFDWGQGAPTGVDGLGVDGFSVRWRGYVRAPGTGDYTFTLTSDDGADLLIENALLVARFGESQGGTAYEGAVPLVADRYYAIEIRYTEISGNASVKLEWEGPGLNKQTVPLASLYNDLPANAVSSSILNTVVDLNEDLDIYFNYAIGDDSASNQPSFNLFKMQSVLP